MMDFIQDLQFKLNQLKGYNVGTSSNCDDSMIIDKDGKRYLVTVEEIENPDEKIMNDMKRYLR